MKKEGQNKDTIYIIGAGVSGLIAAYELEKKGYKPIVFEKSAEVGGRVKTLKEKEYNLDLGFQVLLNAYPLAKEYLDMDALELTKLESGAMVYVNDKAYTIGDPLRNWKILLPTVFAPIGSVVDKLKIFKLNQKLKNKSVSEIFESPETSSHEYLKSFGFSEKIIERFFRPFFAGIFLELDLNTSSRMFEFVYKMFGQGYATVPKLGIGEIALQLKSKLSQTEFHFNTEVEEVTSDHILLSSDIEIPHNGVIISSEASSLIRNIKDQKTTWKACMCLYFEINQTNIPKNTIALVADSGNYSNNFYAFQDASTGKTILSVTTLKHKNKAEKELIDTIMAEIQKYTGASEVNHIVSYSIDQALPDIENLRTTAQASASNVMDNIFLAGDYLFNGSLNAAMESGRLAAKGIMEKREGILL